MISDAIALPGAGRIGRGIETNAAVKAVVDLLATELDAFAQEPNNKGPQPENGLTQRLCRRLLLAARGRPFQFLHQARENEYDGQSASTDLGVVNVGDAALMIGVGAFAPSDLFFVLEAKRLPTQARPELASMCAAFEIPTVNRLLVVSSDLNAVFMAVRFSA